MNEKEIIFNKNILIAVDESENSSRAVSYVARLIGGIKGFKVKVLHVIPEPEEDYFPTSEEKEKWLNRYKTRIDSLLEEYRQMLINGGFAPNDVSVSSTLRYCPSMAKCILDEMDQTQYSTIVVGRKGLSRTEEFLFGSISSKIVKYAQNCTVWVVE